MENQDQTPPPAPVRSGALGSPLAPPKYDEEKLKNLILYTCEKSKDDPHFDDEKLAGLLWQIDMSAFVQTGKSITGATYIKATLADLKREQDEAENNQNFGAAAAPEHCRVLSGDEK